MHGDITISFILPRLLALITNLYLFYSPSIKKQILLLLAWLEILLKIVAIVILILHYSFNTISKNFIINNMISFRGSIKIIKKNNKSYN